MKQTALEDLYYGNINPRETGFAKDSEYTTAFVFLDSFIII